MTPISTISETERLLLETLGHSLKLCEDACEAVDLSTDQGALIYSLADRHEVLVLLSNILNPDTLPPKIQDDLQFKTAKTVHNGITLQSLTARLTALLERENILAITLKGYAAARFYPIPEFRKASDIDLFFCSEEDARKAGEILCENGFHFSNEWHANHHFVLMSEKHEKVELHTAWADEFKDKRLNEFLQCVEKESFAHYETIKCGGARLYVYETAYQALFLAVHMLSHFVGEGFGLRNLCDWVVLWEKCEDKNARKTFCEMVCDSGMAEFVKAVTSVCAEYLGLSREKSPFTYEELSDKELTDALLRDILDAGEFGRSEPERMVGMEGNSFAAYAKEFHHQMHINFPKAGRVALFWPGLWLATLIRFLNNNRKLNRAPISAIMKKAGNRGKLVKRLTADK